MSFFWCDNYQNWKYERYKTLYSWWVTIIYPANYSITVMHHDYKIEQDSGLK